MATADFENLVKGLPGLKTGKMFGKVSLMLEKKAIGCYNNPGAVFKLPAGPREKALGLPGAFLFDPAGKGRAMKEWVVVPEANASLWPEFAQAAYRYLTAE